MNIIVQVENIVISFNQVTFYFYNLVAMNGISVRYQFLFSQRACNIFVLEVLYLYDLACSVYRLVIVNDHDHDKCFLSVFIDIL